MIDKEIIIDGIDVSGCEHHLSTGYCQLQMIFQGMVLKLPFGQHLECNLCDKNCYYKQLKQLEAENAELKAENERLKSCLQEIKEIAEKGTKTEDYLLGQEYTDLIDEILQKIAECENKNDAKEPKTYNGYLKDEMQSRYYKGK